MGRCAGQHSDLQSSAGVSRAESGLVFGGYANCARLCLLGSLTDIMSRPRHVRFAPISGHQSDIAECPLCARSRHSGAPWPSPIAVQEIAFFAVVLQGIGGEEKKFRIELYRARTNVKGSRNFAR
jgi:hypothetical protein